MKENLRLYAFLAFLGWGAYRLWWAFQHPEVWDGQPANDPRVCLPIFGVIGIVYAFVWRRDAIRHRARMRQKDEYQRRFDEATRATKQHQLEGRTEEAEASYHEALRLYFEKREWLDSLRF